MPPASIFKGMHLLSCSLNDSITYITISSIILPDRTFTDYSSPTRPRNETNHNIPLEVDWSAPEFGADVACSEALAALDGADEVDIPLDALMVDPLESVSTAPKTGVGLGKNWSEYSVRPVHVGNPLVWPLDHDV
jgi:hypothetical protein